VKLGRAISDMCADRQTDRQSHRHALHNTPLLLSYMAGETTQRVAVRIYM